jgi:hypothetical protein
MTSSENFVSRWARLKRNSDPRQTPDGLTDKPTLSTSDVSAGRAEEAMSQPRSDAETTDELFDPAGLPSIEAITANTDIRGFLQSCVPLELTRAALRQAWASDPAIRDFIGVAENQWDFNDPDSIPGFGSLQPAEATPAGLAEVSGRFEQGPGAFAKKPATTELAQSSVARPDLAADRSYLTDPDDLDPPNEESKTGEAAIGDRIVGEQDAFRNPRRHGSALPR